MKINSIFITLHSRSACVYLLMISLFCSLSWAATGPGANDLQAQTAENPAQGMGNTLWGADYFPNVKLTTHTGQQVSFFDDLIKDKVVAINFIYTHCPDVCPLETSRMKEVHRLLSDRVGKDIFFYSISIDPQRDTPEVLAEYVSKFQIPPGWQFLTGEESDIILLRRKLGLYIEDVARQNNNDHNISLIIGNQASGRWMKRSPFENPYVLAAQIGGELHNWQQARIPGAGYADAPELPNISPAEQLFRTRCSSCHSIGAGSALSESAISENYGGINLALGPDLFDVTSRRDRSWLLRWIAQPDRMLAEGDPVALSLYEQYQRIAMPNLSLNTQEVESLLSFIESESRRIKYQQRQQQAHTVAEE